MTRRKTAATESPWGPILLTLATLAHVVVIPSALMTGAFASGGLTQQSGDLRELVFIPALGSLALFWASFLAAGALLLAGSALLLSAGEATSRAWAPSVLTLALLAVIELPVHSGVALPGAGVGLILLGLVAVALVVRSLRSESVLLPARR